MLRVGLTGDLGSGKSTVAAMLVAHGAVVMSSDEMGRAMMQPGHTVYDAVVQQFGREIVQPDGSLDRRRLAYLAFQQGRVEELNAIVHPAVLAQQERDIEHLRVTQPRAIVVIESALIFSTRHAGEGRRWRERFDAVVLVTAPVDAKLSRFIKRAAAGRTLNSQERAELEHDARQRLAEQAASAAPESECLVLHNDGTPAQLAQQVDGLWQKLQLLEAAAFAQSR